jgi:outer membrane protein TolC
LDLAELAGYPNLTVGADLTFIGEADNSNMPGSGHDALVLTLGLELPIWRESLAAGERSAEAQLRASERTLQQAHNTLLADLEMAFFQAREGHRRQALFSDSLIPKGEEALHTLYTAYQSGKGGFRDLIDAQRALLEFQLQAARAQTDQLQALATIEHLSGVPAQNKN